ncbi:hypothetical protein AGMMS49936_09360 [Endomicrobiia bacterium]|nr:hypothetical protein AGMMS49936_09360 [Endomicrobiia bacterium]
MSEMPYDTVRNAISNDDLCADVKDIGTAYDNAAANAFGVLPRASYNRIDVHTAALVSVDDAADVVCIDAMGASIAAHYAKGNVIIKSNKITNAFIAKFTCICADDAFTRCRMLITQVPVTDASKAFIKKAFDLELKRLKDRRKHQKQSKPMHSIDNFSK